MWEEILVGGKNRGRKKLEEKIVGGQKYGRKKSWEENLPTNSPSHHFILPQMRTTKKLPRKLTPTPPNEEKGLSKIVTLACGNYTFDKTVPKIVKIVIFACGNYAFYKTLVKIIKIAIFAKIVNFTCGFAKITIFYVILYSLSQKFCTFK